MRLRPPRRPLSDVVLEEALEHLVKGIVDHPEEVTVDLLTNRRGKTLEVRVHPVAAAAPPRRCAR
jgi:hypothetical protein